MGIPGLIDTLEPWAERGTIRGEHVVIDGPAFAYHILSLLEGNGVCMPSAQQLGQTALQWMDHLARQVKIDAIYFDGYLPEAKLNERMSRMVKASVELTRLRTSFTNACPTQDALAQVDGDQSLFVSDIARRRIQTPPSIFLVPVVLEALRSSLSYRSLVHVVPGEADSFCAGRLLTNGGIVLTSDSDLLVHDVGKGRVAFFREIRENEDDTAQDRDSWIFLIYDMEDILRRTGLSPNVDARRVGYEVKRGNRASFNAVVISCLSDLTLKHDRFEFEEFCKEYSTPGCPLPITRQGTRLEITSLDPRISELVLQLGHPTEDLAGDLMDPRMFLPPLNEDALLGSAWTPSTPIRQLAYTIYAWVLSDTSQRLEIQEFRRVQTIQQKGRSIAMMPKQTTLDFIKTILGHMEQLRSTLGSSDNLFWTMLFLITDIRDCEENDKKSHCLTVLTSLKQRRPSSKTDRIDWDLAHFTGHLQACFYSFRILKQLLSIIPKVELRTLPIEVTKLQDELAKLPGIHSFPEFQGTLDLLASAEKTKPLDIIGRFVELPLPPEEVKAPERPKSKKRKERKPADENSAKRRLGNIFSVLQDE